MRLAVGVVLLAAGCPGGAGGGDTGGSAGEPGSTGSPASTSGVTTDGPPTTGAPATTGGPSTSATGEATTSTGTTAAGETSTTATTGASEASATGTTDGASTLSTGAPATLHIEPAEQVVTVASGWSFPAQFTAVLDDGQPMTVPAVWSLDDASLGRVTKHGGTFTARNTAGGTAMLTAEYAGLTASATIEVQIVADHPVCPPRPPLTDGPPTPGAYVKVVAPEYQGTGVYHGLYLPPDWQPGRTYPVIVESPCNKYGEFTGKIEGMRLGYGLAGCRSFIWLTLPYIQNQANLDYGWGEQDKVLAYWQTNLARTLAQFGGDPGAVFLSGFSRGAIGASWVGLYDPTIADAWLAFFMFSHADVPGSNLTPDVGAGATTRMGRVSGRASLFAWGAVGDGGMTNSVKGAQLLESFGDPVTKFAVPNVGHTDVWIESDAATRAQAQDWLFANLAARTGTGAVFGRVTDGQGAAVAGATITAGPLHTTTTDAFGYYALRGLLPGSRTIACAHPQLSCSAPQMVAVAGELEDVDFTAM